MTFLTILGVTAILWSFKLVPEGKAGKEIPGSSRLEKFSANNFALPDAEDNNARPLNRRGIADLPLLRTLLAIHQKSQEPSFWKVMDCFVLLTYASLAAWRTLLQWLLACLNFTLESEDLSFWYKWKKWFLWTMAASQAAENHGDEWGSIWYFLRGMNPLTKFTSSSRSTKLKDILPWIISQMITKTIPISTRIFISYAMKWGILL